jgi:hypothetical protein
MENNLAKIYTENCDISEFKMRNGEINLLINLYDSVIFIKEGLV